MNENDIITSYNNFKKISEMRKQAREARMNTPMDYVEKVTRNSFLEIRNNKDYRYNKSIHIPKPEGVGKYGYGIKPDIRKLKTRI